MFQFPSFAFFSYEFTEEYPINGWVAPFRDPRIIVYLPLPEAYRSLSRLSSLLGAKASTVSP
jgi:hypothetical protein